MTMIATRIALAGAGCLIIPCAEVLAQGSLEPPATALDPDGYPIPSMKTLEQVEPRIPIDSLPFTITESGSYYLARNLSGGGGGTALRVQASNVSIDLNGFELSGSGISEASTAVAIDGVSEVLEGVRVRNGTIRGFGSGIAVSFARGIHLSDLVVSGSTRFAGIIFGSDVTGCTVRNCHLTGSEVAGGALILRPQAGQCSGNLFERCTISGTTHLDPARYGALTLDATLAEVSANIFRQCAVAETTSRGVVMMAIGSGGTCSQNVFDRCRVATGTRQAMWMLTAFGGALQGNAFTACSFRTRSNTCFSMQADQGAIEDTRIERCTVAAATGEFSTALLIAATSVGAVRTTLVRDSSIRAEGRAVLVQGTGDGSNCFGNSFERTSVASAADTAFSLHRARQTRLVGCSLWGAGASTVEVLVCQFGEIADCSIHGDGNSYGVRMDEVDRFQITENHFTGSFYPLISVNTSAGNHLTRNSSDNRNFLTNPNDSYGPEAAQSNGALPDTGAGGHPHANLTAN